MAVTSDTTELGCGRDLDEVWAHADSPPDSHEATCPYCQAARDSLAELASATRQLREEDRNDPSLSLNAGLLTKIISIARAEVRRGSKVPLRYPADTAGTPDLVVTEQTIATVVRRVSDAHVGLEARRCHVEVLPGEVGEPVQVGVELTVGVASGLSIPERVGALREEIRAAVAAEIGVEVAVVDVHAEDVLTEDVPTQDGGPQ